MLYFLNRDLGETNHKKIIKQLSVSLVNYKIVFNNLFFLLII